MKRGRRKEGEWDGWKKGEINGMKIAKGSEKRKEKTRENRSTMT